MATETTAPRGFGWRRLVVVAGSLVVIGLIATMIIGQFFNFFVAGPALFFVVGLLLLRRKGRFGLVVLGILSLLLPIFSRELVDGVFHLESTSEFIPFLLIDLFLLIGVISAIPALRRGPGAGESSRAPMSLLIVSLVVWVGASAVSIFLGSKVTSVEAETGDTEVLTESAEFLPEIVMTDEGRLAIHVTNVDNSRHTFTIDELGVDLNVPPKTEQRIEFDAPAGTYRFYCVPHAQFMEGTLEVG